jgi:hypothetical protein
MVDLEALIHPCVPPSAQLLELPSRRSPITDELLLPSSVDTFSIDNVLVSSNFSFPSPATAIQQHR